MASGWRRIQFNTQERILSPDANRLQTFMHADSAEVFRYLMDVTSNDDLTASAVIAEKSTLEAPLRAEILNGFLVRPQIGSPNILVDAGAAFVLAPDGAADESNYKLLRYDGTALPLTIAANSSGQIRIDVVEMRIDPAEAVVTDSRDVFNSSTGLFTASLLVKEGKAQTDFRVRLGTPGSGYPAAVVGWLPLVVASVPDGTTTTDTVTFWDVRPLVNDRAHGLAASSRDWPFVKRADFSVDDAVGGTLVAAGQFEATIGNYRAGGTLRRGTPGTDADTIDFHAAANLASGFSFAGTGFWYSYLIFPFGLPRWSRYTDASSGARTPRSPRGILVTTGVAPKHMTGKPSAAIALPDSTGLQGSAQEGICVFTGRVTAGTPYGGISDGRVLWARDGAVNDPGFKIAAFALGPTGSDFLLTEGITHPANAKAIYVRFELDATIANTRLLTSSEGDIAVYGVGGTNLAFVPAGAITPIVNNGAINMLGCTGMIRIPIASQYPAAVGAALTLVWWYYLALSDYSGGNYVAPTPNSATMRIYGWDVGP